ncbi:retrovirus-related pol polyprotein from transposon TNT 1-94 [Tanacetum coccineum]
MLVAKSNMFSFNSTRVASSSSVRRPESKDNKLKKIVLLNTKSKSTSKDVNKSQSSVSLVSNKRDTLNSNVSKSNVNVLKAKNVNAMNDGSNLVCVSCGKDVFMISHDKCVARYALSANSKVKRALFNALVAAKSSKVGATPVVVIHVDSGCSKHMTGNLKLIRNFVEKFMGTVRFEGEDLLTGSRDSNLYTIFISEMAASSLVCLMSKATSTKSWLCHRHLSHLNFDTINHLTKQDLVNGLLKLKVQNLKVRSDNGTKFKNEKLRSHYEKLGIMHQTSIARTPQQNGVVKRRNRTLVEAARTMLIFSKSLKFLWAEAISTACFTQNHSLVHTRYNKTPYELIKGRKPNVQYFHVFGSLCYSTNDRDDLGKTKPKAEISIFIGYSESSRGFQIYNRRTRKIMETIHMKFNELTTMASECNNLGPEYYETRTPEVSNNSAANTLNNEDTPSSSSIIVEEYEAPQLVSSSEEPITNEPTTLVLDDNDDGSVQEDVAELDRNTFINPFCIPMLEEAESSSTYHDPSNMHEFYQKHRSTDIWTKNHPLEQVIGDPSKPVMTRRRLHTDAEMCMYALTVSTT